MAQQHNLQRLLGLHRLVVCIPALNSNDTSRQAAVDEAGGLPNTIYLSVGAQVMLKANLCLVNGALGTVHNVI